MKVDVYFNLHKKTLRIRHNGKVVCHSDNAKILNPTFVVSEAGRQRVLREKRKNVHAYVRGELDGFENNSDNSVDDLQTITYNPYKYSTFVKKIDESVVKTAKVAYISKRNILVKIS